MTTEKTNPSLSAFLEEDREHILSELKADPSETHAREVLSRELERLMYRAAEADMGEPAQNMLITVRNTLPIIESVSGISHRASGGRRRLYPSRKRNRSVQYSSYGGRMHRAWNGSLPFREERQERSFRPG